MAYQINKTDGTIIATVADGQIDQLSTDLTLIGKNYSGFGESLNENFIKLLENFSNTSRPTNPIKGQIWFDSSELKLKVYTGLEFIPVSSATIANSQPESLGVGDLWFNDIDKQLFFYDGTQSILLGPDFSASQGLSGLRVQSVLDTLNQTRVITLLYTNGVLLGIFSKDSFTPRANINGFTGSIQPGFNAGNLSGLKFNVTVTNSESLGGIDSATYLRSDTSNSMLGQLTISTDLGLLIGNTSSGSLRVNNGNLFLSNAASDRNLILNVRRGIDQEDAIVINSTSRAVSFYPGYSNSQVSVNGDLSISGNLTVQGTTTTVNSTVITVDDKNIELASISTPTDAWAEGGGITLKGTQAVAVMSGSTLSVDITHGPILTVGVLESGNILPWMKLTGTGVDEDVYITSIVSGAGSGPSANGSVWKISKSQTVSSTIITGTSGDKRLVWTANSSAWNSTEHFNLATGKYYSIGGVPIITQTGFTPGSETFGLTAAVTSFAGVTSFGTQNVVNVGPGIPPTPYLKIENSRISTLAGQDLELAPQSGYNIDLINSPRMTGLSDPSSSQDAATKEYVDRTIESRTIFFSMDLTDGKSNGYIITNVLNKMAPAALYREGTQAKILCTILNTASVNVDLNPLINTSSATFDLFGGGSAPAITAVSISAASIPAQSISTTRVIKTFQISAGVWTHDSDESLPL